MIIIPVFWMEYSATMRGRVLKFVPCEGCSAEYVYILDRESSGVGTSMYMLNNQGAESHAASAAAETLQCVLENDFDPVPCPVCGHYRRHMFPKLLDSKGIGMGIGVVLLVVILIASLAFANAVRWSIAYLQHPNEHFVDKMVTAWSALLFLSVIGLGLWILRRIKIRRFDPNLEDQQARIALGRSRAITRAEFEESRHEFDHVAGT